MPDLPESIKEKFKAVKNIAVVCVIAKLRKPLSEYFWLNVNDSAMDIPGLVEYTKTTWSDAGRWSVTAPVLADERPCGGSLGDDNGRVPILGCGRSHGWETGSAPNGHPNDPNPEADAGTFR